MREFKFRAWDRKRKEMFIVHEIHFDKISGVTTYVSGYGETDKDGTDFYGGGERGYAKAPRYVLQEYTGLRDKNGVEIYEGDIVQIKVDNLVWKYEVGVADSKGTNLYFITRYRNFTLAPEEELDEREYIMGDFYEKSGYTHITDQCEVIGNIYENPELIGA